MYINVFTLYLYFKKYLHVITAVTNLCNYICNYTADPSLTLTTTPVPNFTLKSSKCFTIQHEHNKYIILIFQCKYIVLKAI